MSDSSRDDRRPPLSSWTTSEVLRTEDTSGSTLRLVSGDRSTPDFPFAQYSPHQSPLSDHDQPPISSPILSYVSPDRVEDALPVAEELEDAVSVPEPPSDFSPIELAADRFGQEEDFYHRSSVRHHPRAAAIPDPALASPLSPVPPRPDPRPVRVQYDVSSRVSPSSYQQALYPGDVPLPSYYLPPGDATTHPDFSQQAWLPSPSHVFYDSPTSIPASHHYTPVQLPPEGLGYTPNISGAHLQPVVHPIEASPWLPVVLDGPADVRVPDAPRFGPAPLPNSPPWSSGSISDTPSSNIPPTTAPPVASVTNTAARQFQHSSIQFPGSLQSTARERDRQRNPALRHHAHQPTSGSAEIPTERTRILSHPTRTSTVDKTLPRRTSVFQPSPASWLSSGTVRSGEASREYHPAYVPQDPFRKKSRKAIERGPSMTFSGTTLLDHRPEPRKRSTLSLRQAFKSPWRLSNQPPLPEVAEANVPHHTDQSTEPVAPGHAPLSHAPLNADASGGSVTPHQNRGPSTVNAPEEAPHIPSLPNLPDPRLAPNGSSVSGSSTLHPNSDLRPDEESQLPPDSSASSRFAKQPEWRRRSSLFFWIIPRHRSHPDLASASNPPDVAKDLSTSTSSDSDPTVSPAQLHDAVETYSDVLQMYAHRWCAALYLTLLLFLPSLYFSRVTTLFEEAEMTIPMIEQMTVKTSHQWQKFFEEEPDILQEHEAYRPQWTRLQKIWNQLIDSLTREWQILNIISALLLAAILTVLQIDDASRDYVTRYIALLSFMCALFSLLFGCIYIIRFETMRKTHKAAEWALVGQESTTSTWWNVYVLLALPAVFLTWSILFYIACIMSYIWRTIPNSSQTPPTISDLTALKIRLVLSVLLALAVIYTVLVVRTFRKYGSAMDRTWAKRIEKWRIQEVADREEMFEQGLPAHPSWRDANAKLRALRLDPSDQNELAMVGEVFDSQPSAIFVPPSPPPQPPLSQPQYPPSSFPPSYTPTASPPTHTSTLITPSHESIRPSESPPTSASRLFFTAAPLSPAHYLPVDSPLSPTLPLPVSPPPSPTHPSPFIPPLSSTLPSFVPLSESSSTPTSPFIPPLSSNFSTPFRPPRPLDNQNQDVEEDVNTRATGGSLYMVITQRTGSDVPIPVRVSPEESPAHDPDSSLLPEHTPPDQLTTAAQTLDDDTSSLDITYSELLEPPSSLRSTQNNLMSALRSFFDRGLVDMDPVPVVSTVASVIGNSNTDTISEPRSWDSPRRHPVPLPRLGSRNVRFLRELRRIDPAPADDAHLESADSNPL